MTSLVPSVLGRAWMVLGVAIALGGCAANGENRAGHTAYEKACRSPYMTPAAAREAYWCWKTVGAKSHEEWLAIEHESSEPLAALPLHAGNRSVLALRPATTGAR
jgi:hypothetical protein